MLYYKEGNFVNSHERKEPLFSGIPDNRNEQVNPESKTNCSGQATTRAILGVTEFSLNHMKNRENRFDSTRFLAGTAVAVFKRITKAFCANPLKP